MMFDTSVLQRGPGSIKLDQSGPLSRRKITFTSWLLLGLDVPYHERKYSIPFNKDMFALPNKAGAEAILYFLFNKLNPAMCKEEFRDCWPVGDKKQESLFYRVCNKWLRNIQKDEPDSRLPRINASLFMSPGGEKFYQLLFSFTDYTMQHFIKRECDVKPRDVLSSQVLSPHNRHLSDVMYRMVECGIVQQRQKFLERIDKFVPVSREWRETASELVRENRRLSKSIRELEHENREETQHANEKAEARGSPKRRSYGSEQERTSHMVKRAHRVQKVREKWKKLDTFSNVASKERQVIESILDRTLHKYHIDASEFCVKIPDMLLRECESEIHKRHVDHTYQGGKLNILSLLQLWNLSLHLYIDGFHQVGVPELEEESSHLTAAVHTHQAQIANANAFEKMLREDLFPRLKHSVSRIHERLDSADGNGIGTPQSAHIRTFGLGLVGSSPFLSFTPKDEDTTPVQSHLDITPQQELVMTPEAAETIVATVAKSARKVAKTLFQGSPVYAPKLAMQGKLPNSNRLLASKLPQSSQTRNASVKCRTVEAPSAVTSLSGQEFGQGITEESTSKSRLDHVASSSQTSTESCLDHHDSSERLPERQDGRAGSGLPQKTSTYFQGRDVDDFVDEIVSHVLDVEDAENVPPTGSTLHHGNRLTQSQDLSAIADTNNSHQDTSRSLDISLKNSQNLSTFSQLGSTSIIQKEIVGISNNRQSSGVDRVPDSRQVYGKGSPSSTRLSSHSITNGFTLSPETELKPVNRAVFSEVMSLDKNKSPRVNSQTQNNKAKALRKLPQETNHYEKDTQHYGHRVSSDNEALPLTLEEEETPRQHVYHDTEVNSPSLQPHPLPRQQVYHDTEVNSPSLQPHPLPRQQVYHNTKVNSPSLQPHPSPRQQVYHDTEVNSPSLQPHPSPRQQVYHDTEVNSPSLQPHPSPRQQVHHNTKVNSPSLQPHPSPRQQVHHNTEVNTQSLQGYPYPQPSDQSTTKRLGSHLETEIRKMWRESLDNDPVPEYAAESPRLSDDATASPHHTTAPERSVSPQYTVSQSMEPSTGIHSVLELSHDHILSRSSDSKTFTMADTTPIQDHKMFRYTSNTSVSSNAESNNRSKEDLREKAAELTRKILYEDETLTLDDLTADILLSPELQDKEDDSQRSETSSRFEELFATNTPCIKHLRKTFQVSTSPLSKQHLSYSLDNSFNSILSISQQQPETLCPDLDTSPDTVSRLGRTNILPSVSADVGVASGRIESPSEWLVSLDEGLKLEGGKSPFKPTPPPQNTSSHDELMARYQEIKKTVNKVLNRNSDEDEKGALVEPDLLQSTTNSDEKLMVDLEKKYLSGLDMSTNLLEDETIDNLDLLQDDYI